MSKTLSVLVYQEGNIAFRNPEQRGIVASAIRSQIIPTWNGGSPKPIEETGVADLATALKVYAAIDVITPSNAGVKRVYTSQTVAQILSQLNA